MELYWVATNLAVVSRPRDGDGLSPDLRQLRDSGIDVLASCLTRREEEKLGLEEEATVAVASGLEFVRTTINDHSVPDGESVDDAIEALHLALDAGRRVAVHCYMGLGRSPLIAGALLIAGGVPAEGAIERLSAARGWLVPETAEQRAWLRARSVADPGPIDPRSG